MTEVEMKKNITKIIASVFHYNGLELIEEISIIKNLIN